jgi:hypothetical protein
MTEAGKSTGSSSLPLRLTVLGSHGFRDCFAILFGIAVKTLTPSSKFFFF